MNLGLLKNRKKDRGFKRLIKSFKYAGEGFKYAFKNEQNLIIHICSAVVAILFALIFRISIVEWLFILVMIGLVFCSELVNTSIEALVDLVSPEKHPLAKIAKDTAAGAVLSLCGVAFIGGLIIFIPKVIGIFI